MHDALAASNFGHRGGGRGGVRVPDQVPRRSGRRSMRPSCSAQLDQENETLSLLEAEWSLLIQPARMQELVGRHAELLKLQPLDPTQITKLENLPMRPTRAGAGGRIGALRDPRRTIRRRRNGRSTMTAIAPASTWRHARVAAQNTQQGDSDRRGRRRVGLAIAGFALLYAGLALRLVLLGVAAHGKEDEGAKFIQAAAQARPDIVDRNGETLATDIKTASLFAEPRYVNDPDEATELLTTVFPDLDRDRLRQPALDRRRLRLHQARDHAAPAADGAQARHSGHRLPRREPPLLSGRRDRRPRARHGEHRQSGHRRHRKVSSTARSSTTCTRRASRPATRSSRCSCRSTCASSTSCATSSRRRWRATRPSPPIGIVMDVNTGEVLGMSSLPDYDPNNRDEALDPDKMNRATVGVFEMGSTFKGFTTAMALDSGRVTVHRQLRRQGCADRRPPHDQRLPRQASRPDACRRSSSIPRTSARRGWRSPPARPSSRVS